MVSSGTFHSMPRPPTPPRKKPIPSYESMPRKPPSKLTQILKPIPCPIKPLNESSGKKRSKEILKNYRDFEVEPERRESREKNDVRYVYEFKDNILEMLRKSVNLSEINQRVYKRGL